MDKSKATTAKDCGEKHKYSQKKLELINRAEGKMESGILYNAIFENEKTKVFSMELLNERTNILSEFDPKYEIWKDIVQVYNVEKSGVILCNDMKSERIICFQK